MTCKQNFANLTVLEYFLIFFQNYDSSLGGTVALKVEYDVTLRNKYFLPKVKYVNVITF